MEYLDAKLCESSHEEFKKMYYKTLKKGVGAIDEILKTKTAFQVRSLTAYQKTVVKLSKFFLEDVSNHDIWFSRKILTSLHLLKAQKWLFEMKQCETMKISISRNSS